MKLRNLDFKTTFIFYLIFLYICKPPQHLFRISQVLINTKSRENNINIKYNVKSSPSEGNAAPTAINPDLLGTSSIKRMKILPTKHLFTFFIFYYYVMNTLIGEKEKSIKAYLYAAFRGCKGSEVANKTYFRTESSLRKIRTPHVSVFGGTWK